MAQLKKAFDQLIVTLPIASIRVQREINGDHRRAICYKQIEASIDEIGLIEPLVIFQQEPELYLLLDGHLRLDALRRKGRETVECILSKDDEAYTYNRKVNSIPPVAQHLMILKALKNGLTEERIAASLRVNIDAIRRKRNMLDGICAEAVELLQTRKVSLLSFSLLRKMKPARQVESAKHMLASSVNSASFVRALLYATKSDMLVNHRDQKKAGLADTTKALLAHESDSLLKDLKSLEGELGREALTLTVVRGYVRRIVANPRVLRYLEREHKEILGVLSGAEIRVDPAESALPRTGA